MSSCLLYFGPGARQVAINQAHLLGSLIAEPFGDDGLKTDEARSFVLAMGGVPVGVEIGTLVAGPIDLAMPKASDVILKTIEEFDDTRIQPILWAHDAAGVTPTIRSRCLSRWVDVPDDGDCDQELIDVGFDVVDAIHGKYIYKIPNLVANFKKREHELIGSIADALSVDIHKVESRSLWECLRPVTLLHNPTGLEITAALVRGFCD